MNREKNKNDFLFIAADNDKAAVDYLKENFPSLRVIQKNALTDIKRDSYGISKNQKLIKNQLKMLIFLLNENI